jgi:hypothetical protein
MQCEFKSINEGGQCSNKTTQTLENHQYCERHFEQLSSKSIRDRILKIMESTEYTELDEKYTKLSKADILSYEITYASKRDHVVTINFTLTTDLGIFSGENVETFHETHVHFLIREMIKPDFKEYLKKTLINHYIGKLQRLLF